MQFNDFQIHQRPLEYCGELESRASSAILAVVIHCTELPDLAMAREYAEKVRYPWNGTGNSGHYYIDRDGRTEEWVPIQRVANHVRGQNFRTIGVELVNIGRYPEWFDSTNQVMTERYPLTQIDSLIDLLLDLKHRLPSLRWLVGHDQLDVERVPASDNPDVMVFRKRDPGPLFPWIQVFQDVPLQPLPEGATIR